MTTSLDRLENALYQVISIAGNNDQVIIERPNAPRPKIPYTGIRYITSTAEIFDWPIFNIDTDQTRWYGFRELTYSINCYGQNAMDEAMHLNSRLTWQSYRDLLRSIVSSSILSKGTITDISTLMSEAFEKRASFDLFLLANIENGSTVEEGSDYFDKVTPPFWKNSP